MFSLFNSTVKAMLSYDTLTSKTYRVVRIQSLYYTANKHLLNLLEVLIDQAERDLIELILSRDPLQGFNRTDLLSSQDIIRFHDTLDGGFKYFFSPKTRYSHPMEPLPVGYNR